MSNNFSENFLREQICVIGKSLFDRGLLMDQLAIFQLLLKMEIF